LSGALALLVSTFPIAFAFLAIVFAAVFALTGIVYLERAPYERQVRKPAAAID